MDEFAVVVAVADVDIQLICTVKMCVLKERIGLSLNKRYRYRVN